MVELEQERVEQHDITDRQETGLVTRHEDQECHGELKRGHDAKDAGKGTARERVAPPIFEGLGRALVEPPRHPSLTSCLAESVDDGDRVTDEAGVLLTAFHRRVEERFDAPYPYIVQSNNDDSVTKDDQREFPTHQMSKKGGAESNLYDTGQETADPELRDDVECLLALLPRRANRGWVVVEKERMRFAEQAREECQVGDEAKPHGA